ncbi:MAG: 50S ribosomal protein L29 [Clostridiales Family XIII bacterium]|jgi:large subunit ribosomal protein L29|nr:50S ribosomal protein L29 [Clostridiales Family XIII bacterium]
MNLEKVREMSDIELDAELKKMKNELFNLRFQHVTGQLENPIKMRDIKRDIARVKTIIREKELAAEQPSA